MLELRDLVVTIGPHEIVAIDELDITEGRRAGLVGESGSGKSMTAMSISGLQPREAKVSGSVRFKGQELVGMRDQELAGVRGSEIGVIFQDPLRALNPMMRIGRQVAEAIRMHSSVSRRDARERVVDLFRQVHLPDPEGMLRRYPHQISGGQRQRVLIAVAIASEPSLLIADEPTTALDVTVQRGILELLVDLSEKRDMALLFVSHDLGVVQAVCQDVAVIYGGRLVEFGPGDDVLGSPHHRYTEALIGANPGETGSDDLGDLLGRPLTIIPGSVPPVGQFPDGCRFRGRCAFELDRCAEDPPSVQVSAQHRHRCWNPREGGAVDERTG